MAELLEQYQTDTCLMDISKAGNSVQACHLAESFIANRLSGEPQDVIVDVNAGDLLLTRGVLAKLKQLVRRAGGTLGTMYATVPQTQQAALDEGLFVKEKRSDSEKRPLRQPLPILCSEEGDRTPAAVEYRDVNLPDFQRPTDPSGESKIYLKTEELDPEAADIEPEEPSEPNTTEPVQGEAVSAVPVPIPLEETPFPTLYYRQNLRSGQMIRFNGHIVLVGDAHAGSEILAGGDIVVWGELRGIAHAGAQGNYKAEIRAMRIEALQLRIADYIARRPDRIYYHKENAEQNVISPEVARVADGEIKVFKTGHIA